MTIVHRFVKTEQVTEKEQPVSVELEKLLYDWGLTRSVVERLWVIALDNVDQVKVVTEVAVGGFHDVVVHIPNVLAAVLAAQTDRFLIAHNHPSGPVQPTTEDIDMTGAIVAAANVAGLTMDDSIITGPEGWFSFYDEGIFQRASRDAIKIQQRRRGK